MRPDRVAVATAAVAAGYRWVVRPWQTTWGATRSEVDAAMPGDELVPRPACRATNAVTVRAEPDQIWPWLAQMGGYTRAGWYSYDLVDNAGVHSADRVVPELQDVSPGTRMATAPGGAGFDVVSVDRPRSLVLALRQPSGVVSSSFTITRAAPGATRLVNRTRLRVRPRTLGDLAFVVGMDVGHVVMTRRMLLGIAERAERLARAVPGAHDPEDRSPGMPLEYDLAVVVRRSARDVFALLVDVQDWTGDASSPVTMEKLPEGPTVVGTRWRERVRLVPGVWMTVWSQVAALEPERLLDLEFRSVWFQGRLTYVLEPVADGTRLVQRERVRMRGVPRAAVPAVDRSLRWHLLRRLADIRDALEVRTVVGRGRAVGLG
ncbi:MAG: SRPBCC family protein [Actinomycetota bacterium]